MSRVNDYELSHLILRFEQEKDIKVMHCVQNLAALRDLVDLRIEAAGLRKELEQAKAALEACQPWTPQLLKQYVTDTSDGFECLPGCDSHGHEELCPVTNVVQAFRLLRERLEQAKAAEISFHRDHKNCVSNFMALEKELEHVQAENTRLREALTKLTNEASGFVAMAHATTHGVTNMRVMHLRIAEAEAALTVPPAPPNDEKEAWLDGRARVAPVPPAKEKP